jgi:hypothetical protein
MVPEARQAICARIENEVEYVKDFETKLNKYGFIHIPKKVVPSLPFESEKPLTARIEENQIVISGTPKNQSKTEKK